MKQGLEVIEASQAATAPGGVRTGERVERLVALGGTLSDPIRVRMLGMMAEGRGCCGLPNRGVTAEDQEAGICVCEFEQYFGMGQSKVSYHLRKLKDAGLVREEKRGKWSFYAVDKEAVESLLGEAGKFLLTSTRECC
jgi:ArsR family transcriptional regulator